MSAYEVSQGLVRFISRGPIDMNYISNFGNVKVVAYPVLFFWERRNVDMLNANFSQCKISFIYCGIVLKSN